MSDLLPLKQGFTIYQSPFCPYCQESLEILQTLNRQHQISLKNVNLDEVEGGKSRVVHFFKANADKYGYDKNHDTRPIIFFNRRFIGGNSDLKRFLTN